MLEKDDKLSAQSYTSQQLREKGQTLPSTSVLAEGQDQADESGVGVSAPPGPSVRKPGPHRRGSDLPASPGSTSAECHRGVGGGHSAAGGPRAQDTVPRERARGHPAQLCPRRPQRAERHRELMQL